MKLVRREDVNPVGAERRRVRPGGLQVWRLMLGTPGTPGNFLCAFSTSQATYGTPRHRHNFEQIRYQIGGEFDYEREGKMTAGMVGYFPEGTFYGPSQSGDDSAMLILQFGGASGSGYMSQDEYDQGVEALSKRGTFHEGTYSWVDDNGKKHNKDGYEAVWEQSRGRRLTYPPSRYDRPVYMRPESFSWTPSKEHGVRFKALGTFSEREVKIGFVCLDADARARHLPGRTLYFAVRGEGTAQGQSWGEHTLIHLEAGETMELHARAPTEFFYIGLPDLEGCKTSVVSHELERA